jgi:HEAT repeat protein
VPALVKALSHQDSAVRSYVAEALASIGPAAAPATPDLTKALRDLVPGVRWAAAEALAAIGPKAAPAIPDLIEALKDEFLYVRICAVGALGSIGLKSEAALAALKEAANDPAMRAEAEWALHQIAGVAPGANAPSSAQPAEGERKAAAVLSGLATRGTPGTAGGEGRPPCRRRGPSCGPFRASDGA